MSGDGEPRCIPVEQEALGDPEDASIGKGGTDFPLDDSLCSEFFSTSLQRSKLSLHELSFLSFPNQSQSNIYGLVHIRCDGSNMLLVATLQGEVFCLEHGHDGLRTTLKPINFSYIPADANIISMDAFVRDPRGVVVGVTFVVKRDSEPSESYFNIYGSHLDPTGPLKWDKIAEDWQPLKLESFIPFQLTHTQIFMSKDQQETVFLLSGDDLQVHMYRQVLVSDKLTYQEEPTADKWFPEFQALPSSVTSMDVRLYRQQRTTAFGCQNGFLKCCVVDIINNDVLKTVSTDSLDGPITSVRLFTVSSCHPLSDSGQWSDFPCHLLATSAVELGALFRDILTVGMDSPLFLPSSDRYDSVLCSTVADMTWDSVNELVLGTYGQKVLVYKLVQQRNSGRIHVELIWDRSFAYPVHGVWYGDITGDGLSELAVLSTAGIHVLQHDLKQALDECILRLQDPPSCKHSEITE